MNDPYRPGPIKTRPLTEEEKDYFRKRQEKLRKRHKIPKVKNWNRHKKASESIG